MRSAVSPPHTPLPAGQGGVAHEQHPSSDNLRMSYKGMAYFAGTGPCACKCSECARYHPRKDHWGEKRQEGYCGKRMEMANNGQTSGRMQSYPGKAPACKYFMSRPDKKSVYSEITGKLRPGATT